MAGVKLAFFSAWPAESLHKFARTIEFEHVICTITVRDKDRTIRADRHCARLKSVRVVVINLCALREFYGPLTIAIEFQLEDLVVGGSRGVKVFRAIFLAQLQAM